MVVNEKKRSSVEADSQQVEKLVDDVIKEYAEDLDSYMTIIDNALEEESEEGKQLSDIELDEFTLNLSSILYFASSGVEDMAIKEDIARALQKEAYNNARVLIEFGTVKDKDAQAELATAEERIISVIYAKAYRKLKAKVEAAEDMRGTLKKIMSRRIAEAEMDYQTKDGGEKKWQQRKRQRK